MNSTNSQSLLTAGVQTLETFAFMMIDPINEDQECDFLMGVTISFSGKINGKIEIWTEESFLSTVHETLMGSSDTSENKIGMEKCLMEIANIVAGNFLTENFGVHTEFDLHLPERCDFQGFYENRVWLSDMETDGKILLQVELENVEN